VRIEFDAGKDRQNKLKHGISLSFAQHLDWGNGFCWPDARFPYTEFRMRGLVPGGEVIYFVAFVERSNGLRILSLRKANRNEERIYARNSYHC